MNVTKDELANAIAQKAGISKSAAGDAIDALIGTIKDRAAMGDKITLRNFGTFHQAHRAERKVRNPATGAESVAPASSTLKFKAAKPK
jgi:DNA-binding protein HU-beta